jgi:hypothetical protein
MQEEGQQQIDTTAPVHGGNVKRRMEAVAEQTFERKLRKKGKKGKKGAANEEKTMKQAAHAKIKEFYAA